VTRARAEPLARSRSAASTVMVRDGNRRDMASHGRARSSSATSRRRSGGACATIAR
jgi:hypothetical protein